jgi:REP-associated tyrosine transposase
MVLAYHVIFGVYGFWLPNDPRGSWSTWVASWELYRHGPATKTRARRSLAGLPHDLRRRSAAKVALKYPPVRLNGTQALAVGRGFKQAAVEADYIILACSILPEHVHLVLRRSDRRVELMIAHLKRRATQCLGREGLHPLANCARSDGSRPSPWARGSWCVYLNTELQTQRAIDYVVENLCKEGKPEQRWSLVQSR